jgi:spore coat polysaccharide biosynthesis protein SpsF (cytidylyltransferase family)
MRLTADCPLIQADICDKVIETYFRSGVDYIRTGKTFAEGLDCEVFSFAALEMAWKRAALPSEREHVTLYCFNHPDKFKIQIIENEVDDSRYRITVDEMVDFLAVEAILECLYEGSETYFTIEDIKHYYEEHPEVYGLNSAVLRNHGLTKSIMEDKKMFQATSGS